MKLSKEFIKKYRTTPWFDQDKIICDYFKINYIYENVSAKTIYLLDKSYSFYDIRCLGAKYHEKQAYYNGDF